MTQDNEAPGPGRRDPAVQPPDGPELHGLASPFVDQARQGGSAGLFSLTGTQDTADPCAGFDPVAGFLTTDRAAAAPSTRAVDGNRTGGPDTNGYTRLNGASTHHDGFGRSARDDNSLFVYAWTAC